MTGSEEVYQSEPLWLVDWSLCVHISISSSACYGLESWVSLSVASEGCWRRWLWEVDWISDTLSGSPSFNRPIFWQTMSLTPKMMKPAENIGIQVLSKARMYELETWSSVRRNRQPIGALSGMTSNALSKGKVYHRWFERTCLSVNPGWCLAWNMMPR